MDSYENIAAIATAQKEKEAHRKKERSPEAQQAIDLIKKAVEERKAAKKSKYEDDFDQEIIRLHDQEHIPFSKIGEKLKCSPTTAKSHYDKLKGIK